MPDGHSAAEAGSGSDGHSGDSGDSSADDFSDGDFEEGADADNEDDPSGPDWSESEGEVHKEEAEEQVAEEEAAQEIAKQETAEEAGNFGAGAAGPPGVIPALSDVEVLLRTAEEAATNLHQAAALYCSTQGQAFAATVHAIQQQVRDAAALVRQRGQQQLAAAQQPMVYFCTTAMARDSAVKAALPINLLFLMVAPSDYQGAIALVTFNADAELVAWIRLRCAAAIRLQHLALASGGDYVEACLTANSGGGAPSSSTPVPSTCPPMDAERKTIWWHASACKNTAHAVALSHCDYHNQPMQYQQDLVLINLDGDNIIGRDFMLQLQRHTAWYRKALTAEAPARPFLLCCPTGQPGLTGRIGLSATTFITCGGYDENCFGSGAQDLDLRERVGAAQIAAFGKRYTSRIERSEVAGIAVPNTQTSFREDRGTAKDQNMNPEDVASAGGTWANMNEHNMELLSGRRKSGQISRNGSKMWWELGHDFRHILADGSLSAPTHPATGELAALRPSWFPAHASAASGHQAERRLGPQLWCL